MKMYDRYLFSFIEHYNKYLSKYMCGIWSLSLYNTCNNL